MSENSPKLDLATREKLWTDPDWTCPNCKAVNFAIRERCRFCGYDSNCGEFPWYNPLPPYDGLAK
jgi:RecB family exonuclease